MRKTDRDAALALKAMGWPSVEIARALKISDRTVRRYLRALEAQVNHIERRERDTRDLNALLELVA